MHRGTELPVELPLSFDVDQIIMALAKRLIGLSLLLAPLSVNPALAQDFSQPRPPLQLDQTTVRAPVTTDSASLRPPPETPQDSGLQPFTPDSAQTASVEQMRIEPPVSSQRSAVAAPAAAQYLPPAQYGTPDQYAAAPYPMRGEVDRFAARTNNHPIRKVVKAASIGAVTGGIGGVFGGPHGMITGACIGAGKAVVIMEVREKIKQHRERKRMQQQLEYYRAQQSMYTPSTPQFGQQLPAN